MTEFTGFPAGKLRYTPIPDVFFSQVLPAIDNVAEAKVTLHVLWRLYRKRGSPRTVSRAELLDDPDFMRGLGGPEALDAGLSAAVRRGTLLRLDVEAGCGPDEWYVANSVEGRRAAERLAAGDLEAAPVAAPAAPDDDRPNIFVLYEQAIGLLSPIIADELREAEQAYPAAWISDAFRIAVENNVRKWAYVRRILERWAAEGKDDGTDRRDPRAEGRRYIEGKYGDLIQH